MRHYDTQPNYAYPYGGMTYTYETTMQDGPLGSIFGQYSEVTSFDSTGAKSYDPSLPFEFMNNLKYMGPNYGYWINMTTPGNLNF